MRARRLRKRRDFLRVQNHGHRVYTRRLIFHFSVGRTALSRLGVTVSRKVGNAVVRNRVKRWVREAWRQHPELHRRRGPGETSYDLVVTAKRGIDDFSYPTIRDELVHVLTRFLDNPTPGGRRRRRRGVERGR